MIIKKQQQLENMQNSLYDIKIQLRITEEKLLEIEKA